MRESLRGRLIAWYTAILALVITSFASVVVLVAWRDRLAEIDAGLARHVEVVAAGLRADPSGTYDLDLPAAAREAAGPVDHVIWTRDGEVLDASTGDLRLTPPGSAGVRSRAGRRELVARVADGAWVLAGQSLEPVHAEMVALAAVFAGVGGVALLLSVAGGWWWVGRALAPIDRISRTARAMSDGDLAARIPVDRVETELGQVATALNGAFDQLHASLARQRRFAADASHELRTPVTTIAIETEWALDRDRALDEYRQSLAVCRRAADRMTGVVEQLLALARAEAAEAAEGQAIPCALDAAVRDAVEDLRPLARHAGVEIQVRLEPAVVLAEPGRLREAVAAIVHNAIQYNVAAGRVEVEVAGRGGAATLAVSDTGIGIPATDCDRVFDAFVRLDEARGRSRGGAGLGLAVARAAFRASAGDVTAAPRPGGGTVVTVVLPLAPRRLVAL